MAPQAPDAGARLELAHDAPDWRDAALRRAGIRSSGGRRASRAIDRLTDLLDGFKSAVNDGNLEPRDFTVPETKGLKVLKANREFADGQIEIGYKVLPTQLYGIPCNNNGKICFFDIESSHWEQYDYKMNPFQEEKYGSPLFKEEEPLV